MNPFKVAVRATVWNRDAVDRYVFACTRQTSRTGGHKGGFVFRDGRQPGRHSVPRVPGLRKTERCPLNHVTCSRNSTVQVEPHGTRVIGPLAIQHIKE
jgi:hypothetical protein